MNASMVIRIAGSLAELKRNLAEGKNQIEVTTAGMKKLAASLDGNRLIQHAHNIAAAVKEVGGVTKLTEAEKARLNVTLQKAIDKYKALGKEAPTALKELAEATKKPTTSMFSLDSAVGKAAATIAATFTVGAVIGAIKSTGDWGGRIVDTAEKLKISTNAVQRYDHAAKQHGQTLDTVSAAMGTMSKKLVEGEGSTVGALDKLNLQLHHLRQLSPDQAFNAIARAVADVPDPMQQTALAAQLLGRSGADLIPMFATLEDDMASAVVANRSAVEAADRLGDSWDKLVSTGTSLLGAVLVPLEPAITRAAHATAQFAQAWFDVADAARRAADELERVRKEAAKPRLQAVPSFSQRMANASGFQGGPDVAILRQLDAITFEQMLEFARGQLGKTHSSIGARPFGAMTSAPFDPLRGQSQTFIEQALTKPVNAAISIAEKARDFLNRTGARARAVGVSLTAVSAARTEQQFDAAVKAATVAIEQQEALRDDFRAVMAVAGKVVPGDLPRALQRENRLGVLHPGLFDARVGKVSQVTPGRLPAALQIENLMGGPLKPTRGGFLGGLTGGFKDLFKGMTGGGGVGGFLNNIGGGIAQGFGQMISGGISSLIGTGLNFAVKGLGKLFGFGPSAAKQTADMRKQWLEQAGGVEKFRAAAERAGVSVDRIFNAKKPKDFEAAVKSVTAQIQTQEERQQRLNSVAERYGITIDQYGRKMRQQQLNEQIRSIMEDYRDLLDLTENVVLSTEKIAPAVNEYLRIAIRTGAEVPVSLRPIIQRMQEMGLLAEDNAEKLGDITWAETMAQGFDRVVAAVNRLTDALLGAADASTRISVPSVPGDGGGVPGTGDPIPQLHRGGLLRRAHNGWYVYRGGLSSDEVPIVAQTGEGVLSRRGMAAFDAMNQGRVPSGPSNAEVVAELREVRRELRQSDVRWEQIMTPVLMGRGGR